MEAFGMTPYATTQSRVLALVTASGRYRCQTIAEQRAARILNGKGLLKRDRKDAWVWYPAGVPSRPVLRIVGEVRP